MLSGRVVEKIADLSRLGGRPGFLRAHDDRSAIEGRSDSDAGFGHRRDGVCANPERKQLTEENYRVQVATIPKHKVVFAPKARHFIQLDEPEFLFQEMEAFLKEANAAGR